MRTVLTVEKTRGIALAMLAWCDDSGSTPTVLGSILAGLNLPGSVGLTFAELHEQSGARLSKWHGPGTLPWSGADWSNAMCGEAGEAANVVKKLRRHETGTATDRDPSVPELLDALALELGDVVAYLELLATHYGLDLGDCVARKFNLVSEREGWPERVSGGAQ